MTPTPEDQARLERLIHRTLRELPSRHAPSSLEQRVRTEIARRAALPWWRQGFAHWPLAARAAFVPLSTGIAALVLLMATRLATGFDNAALDESLAQPLAWLESARTVTGAIGHSFTIIWESIPPLWLYGGLAFCAVMYAALFGLGTAAYRTFQAQR